MEMTWRDPFILHGWIGEAKRIDERSIKRIETAGLLLTGKGFGDIPLALSGGDRIGWLNLWPHARPWRLAKPEPMLRCIADAQALATMLQKAWTEASGKTSVLVQTPRESGSANTVYCQTNALQ